MKDVKQEIVIDIRVEGLKALEDALNEAFRSADVRVVLEGGKAGGREG